MTQLALICGGKSTEHEISLLSTQSILNHINRDHYQIHLIKINRDGFWSMIAEDELASTHMGSPVTLLLNEGKTWLVNTDTGQRLSPIDVVFPVLHGMNGEDGTIQGLLSLLNVPYVGCGVLASAACMDKDVTKRLLEKEGMATAPYCCAYHDHVPTYASLTAELGETLFIKPANLGSSVGVFKVKNEKEYREKIKAAFLYDHKLLIEKAIVGKEVECSVLGNQEVKTAVPGEIVTATDFYDFASKYVDKEASKTLIPADISSQQLEEVKNMASKAYRILGCEGLARVDFFVCPSGDVLINEINTMPGFTSISMYPAMWEASGLSYPELIDELIRLAFDRHHQHLSISLQAKMLNE